MATPVIRTATAADAESAIATLVLAFSEDPAVRWTWPDPQQYLTHFPNLVKAMGGKAFDHGSAYYVEGYAGAALWLPPDVGSDEDALFELLQRTVPMQQQKDVLSLMEQMDHYHPQEPHWYLPFIGVDPIHQGKGYGSALLKHALLCCDRDRTPAYLESSNPRNIPLYERHGFEIIGTIQAGSSPPIYPMLRKPQ